MIRAARTSTNHERTTRKQRKQRKGMNYDKQRKGYILTEEEVHEITEKCARVKAMAEQLEQLQSLQLWLPSEPKRRLLN